MQLSAQPLQKARQRLGLSGKDGGVYLPPRGIQYRHYGRRLDVETIYLSSLIRVLLLVKVGLQNPTIHNQGRPFIVRGPPSALSPAGAGRVWGLSGTN